MRARKPGFLLSILIGPTPLSFYQICSQKSVGRSASPLALLLFILRDQCAHKWDLWIEGGEFELLLLISAFSLRFPPAEETVLQKGLNVVAQVLMSQWTVVFFFPFPFSLKMAFCLYCYFCCKCGLNSSRYAWFFWCYIKVSVAWTHLKFLPKLVFKFHHNQMINVLPDWTSPWLIVWFSRHWGREDEVKGKLRWCWLCCPALTSWVWKGEGCKCTSHSCCEGAGDFDLSKLFL